MAILATAAVSLFAFQTEEMPVKDIDWCVWAGFIIEYDWFVAVHHNLLYQIVAFQQLFLLHVSQN